MSRKYREYKAYLIDYYGRKGKYPSYKMTLYRYKKLKRKNQKYEKRQKKFLRTLRQGAVLVIPVEEEKC